MPVVVRDIPDERLLAAALIENIQREDLNPIEEAQAYRRLADEFQPDAGADRRRGRQGSIVGRELHAAAEAAAGEVRDNVASGALSMGHARALVAPDEAAQLRVGREVVAKGLSVRETEALVKKRTAPPPSARRAEEDVHTARRRRTARFALGTRVRIVRKGKGGTIEIDFTTRTSCSASTSTS